MHTARPGRVVLTALAAVVVAVDFAVAATQFRPMSTAVRFVTQQPVRLVRDADVDPLIVFVPTGALAGAAWTIPSGETYAVAVGNDPPTADPELVRIVFRFWLLPRRYTADVARADWVIVYHEPSEAVHVPIRREVGVAPGVNVVQVAR